MLKIDAELKKQNINYLKQKNTSFVNRLVELSSSIDNNSYEIVEGKSVTVSVNGIQLTSRHDRELFAMERCQHIATDCKEVHVYGFGLGDDIRYLSANISSQSKIYVHILNAEVFMTILGVIELPCQNNDQIIYIADDDNGKIDHNYVVSVSDLIIADDHHQKIAASLESLLEVNISRQLFLKNLDKLKKRIELTRSYISRDPDINELFNIHRGKKFAVISSGPSLESCLTELKEMKDRGVVIIAVDTSGKCLSSAKILADYMITVDANIRLNLLGLEAFSQASLIYSPVSDAELLNYFQDRRYAAYTSGSLCADINKEIPHTCLFSSGSVTHCAVDLAVKMGASEVFLYGCDFAFPNNKFHAGYDKCQTSNRDPLINSNSEFVEVMAQDGKKIPTCRNFRAYLYDLERYIEDFSDKVTFVNMSTIGATIRGTVSYVK